MLSFNAKTSSIRVGCKVVLMFLLLINLWGTASALTQEEIRTRFYSAVTNIYYEILVIGMKECAAPQDALNRKVETNLRRLGFEINEFSRTVLLVRIYAHKLEYSGSIVSNCVVFIAPFASFYTLSQLPSYKSYSNDRDFAEIQYPLIVRTLWGGNVHDMKQRVETNLSEVVEEMYLEIERARDRVSD